MPHMKTKNKQKQPMQRMRHGARGPVRFPGINAACAALGCSRTHLYSVLTGQRQSRSLLARYEALGALAQ